MMFKTLHDV